MSKDIICNHNTFVTRWSRAQQYMLLHKVLNKCTFTSLEQSLNLRINVLSFAYIDCICLLISQSSAKSLLIITQRCLCLSVYFMLLPFKNALGICICDWLYVIRMHTVFLESKTMSLSTGNCAQMSSNFCKPVGNGASMFDLDKMVTNVRPR